ncbi:hypothetical protein BGS_1113 [Beggiatoa sp. SS]|nr:hypothetical protein BGS_1113 [Beggiatoa sp. SS]
MVDGNNLKFQPFPFNDLCFQLGPRQNNGKENGGFGKINFALPFRVNSSIRGDALYCFNLLKIGGFTNFQ